MPYFVKEGVYYKWSHKSFLEYFAAVYVLRSKEKEDIINNIYNSNRIESYVNFLDIYYDLDPELIDNQLVLPVINEYLDVINSIPDTVDIDLASLMFNHIIYIEPMDNVNNREEYIIQFDNIVKRAEARVSEKTESLYGHFKNGLSFILFVKEIKNKILLDVLDNKHKKFVKKLKFNSSENIKVKISNGLLITKENIHEFDKSIEFPNNLIIIFDYESTIEFKKNIHETKKKKLLLDGF